MSVKENKKNGTLEFLRFVFCICILLFHIGKYILGEASLKNGIKIAFFPHGAIGVEFFFILTGIFLAKKIDSKRNKDGQSDIGEDSAKYLLNKYKSVFPYHIVAFTIIFCVTAILSKYSFFEMITVLIDSIPGILLIQMTGIPGVTLNHIEWYLSAMLIAIAIIYPICKKNFNLFVKYIAPVGSILILGYLGKKYGSLTGVSVWTGIAFKGVIRGFAEIMLGTFAYYIAKELSNKYKQKLKRKSKILLTILEWSIYVAIIVFVMMTFAKKYEFAALFGIFCGVVISYSELSYSRIIFNNKVFYFLGKLSLPIYLSQLTAINLVRNMFAQYDNSVKICYAIAITIVLAIITMVIGNIIKDKMYE